jgi:SAM-dependent methyltransferase
LVPKSLAETVFALDRLKSVQPDLVAVSFGGLRQWKEWVEQNRWSTDKSHIESFVPHAQINGISSLWLGSVLPHGVVIRGEPPALHLLAGGLWEIERMLLDLIAAMPMTDNPYKVRIYGAEAQSAFALAMRGRFPRFIGSGFYPEDHASLFPIEHQDLTRLTYPAGTFDLAVTVEVLEHVPTIPAALTELARILRPGGVMISTVPFRYFDEKTEIKAQLVGGEIMHLTDTPEYHQDPHRKSGTLVFQLPGWDILDMARLCGFRRAEFLFYSTKVGGIVTQPHLAGRWALVCQR